MVSVHIRPNLLVDTIDLSDYEMTWTDAPNPYVVGDLSTVSYYTVNESNKGHIQLKEEEEERKQHVPFIIGDNSSSLPLSVYRLDAALSKLVQPDGHSDTKCSGSYLFSSLYNNPQIASCEKTDLKPLYNYAIMKVTIPYTFNVFDDNEQTFNDYDARYFSVSSHLCSSDLNNTLPFWSVNTRMMSDFLNKTSLESANEPFYLFFAPIDDVRNYASESSNQGELTSTPPVFEWGIYQGFLLAIPDFNFIFRYRVPNSNWLGNPDRSPCYKAPQVNQPVSNISTEWVPEIFGDNFDSFEQFVNSNTIGPIPSTGGGW